jgi:endonuclease YncB( thermonuclease family)
MGSPNALILAMCAGCIAAALDVRATSAEPAKCAGGSPAETFHAVSAPDGSMIVTKEGGVIRLAGIVAPGESDRDIHAGEQAAKALQNLVAGKKILVRTKAGGRDRYGRIVGQVELAEGAEWIQAALVTAGVARVAPQIDGGGCAVALLALERQARSRKAGLWAEPNFTVRGSQEIAELTAAEGRYMLVEGVVRRVGESGGRVFLDFGARFNEDFSVIVPRDAHKAFTNAGIDLRSLKGARLRVRGIVSMRGGPAIELRDPSAMELVKDGV